MPLDSAPSMQLAYKAHSSGNITPGSEPVLSSNPGASSAKILRRTRSSLQLRRATFQPNEYRSDMQVSDYRLGGKRIDGAIAGELSPLTYQDFFEAATRATWASAISKSNTEFTSMTATNSTAKFTVGGSSWDAQGFRRGDVVRFTNLSVAANNSKNFYIVGLSGTEATVFPAPTDMSADTSFTVATVGRKLVVPSSAHVSRLFAFEHYYPNADVVHVFSECRIGGFRLNLPAEGVATVEFPVLGRNATILSGGSAPFFTSPSAPTSSSVVTTIGGMLHVDGVAQGVITAASLNLDLGLTAPAVAFNALPPDIFYNTISVTGEVTALLFDNSNILSYVNETEVQIGLMLTTSSADAADFVSIYLPRCKFTGADVGDGSLEGVPVRLPFQALLKATATGFDATCMTLQDSLSA